MATNGRAKGATFERDLARTITVWWTGDKSYEKKRAEELPFRRTPLSGGWDKKAAASDLLVTDPNLLPVPWIFALEAKNQECWDWDGLFKDNAKWPVKAYWEQCCEAATASKLRPLVLFTRNRQPIYFAMANADVVSLNLSLMGAALASKTKSAMPTLPNIHASWLPFTIGRFDDLLKLTPQQIVAGLAPLSADSSKQVKAGTPATTKRPQEPRSPASGVRVSGLILPEPTKDWVSDDTSLKILETRR